MGMIIGEAVVGNFIIGELETGDQRFPHALVSNLQSSFLVVIRPNNRYNARMKTAFIMCGALAREVLDIIDRHKWDVDVYGIPAIDHMFPERIAPDVERKFQKLRDEYGRIFVIFGDCGSRGALDGLLEKYGLERVDGPHCYEMYGGETFHDLMAEEPGTFFLTDFLVRGFRGTILKGMGLDKYPQLKEDYFRNYKRIVYLEQKHDPELVAKAQIAADFLELPLEIRHTAYGLLEERLVEMMSRLPQTKVTELFDAQHVAYRVLPHEEPVYTVETAAAQRGVVMEEMVKSILLRETGSNRYVMACVLGGDRLDAQAARPFLPGKWRRLTFATGEEITAATGYTQGAVAPLCLPDNLPVIFDAAIAGCERVNISSGHLMFGLELAGADLIKSSGARLAPISKKAQ